jgi:MFS family permease
MLRPYLEVLRLPHALRVFVPAQLGKLSFSMTTLAVILAVQGATGSFAAAGATTGAFGLANVVAAPARARFIDRRGQRFALSLLAVCFGIAAIALGLATAVAEPSVPVLVGLGAVLGLACPPVGAAMRVLWSDIAPAGPLLARAYSLDAVVEEVLFTLGPFVVSIVVAVFAPPAGLFATAIAAVAGTIAMTSGAASRKRVATTETAPPEDSPLRQRGFVPLLVALLGGGIVIGAVEVAVPASASAEPAIITGVLMAMMPVGSGTGGLLYGAVHWRSRAVVRLVAISVAIAAACAVLGAAPNLVVLAILLIVVGFFISPGMITGYVLVDELTAPSVRTEAFAWVGTATNLGAAAASAAGGWLVDHVSVQSSFLLGAIGALACAVASAPFLLRRRSVMRSVGT